jgi:predicted deacetylase
MAARYLIRFDDICPTMNWAMWSKIEPVLVEQQIRPLLAVIPDNRDEKLYFAPPGSFFWERVRAWQARGWSIGLHGYQHRFVTEEPGIVRIQRRSEFAGVPRADQDEKLVRAIEIFQSHGVQPQVWIAPAHSFDWETVSALQELGITTISDGLALAPHTDSCGRLWVPQQLWKFRWRPFGVWTVCYHHNVWQGQQFARFLREVAAYRGAITDLAEVSARYGGRKQTMLDDTYRVAHSAVLCWRRRKRAEA